MYKLYKYLHNYKFHFETPDKNLFKTDVIKEENGLELNYSKRDRSDIFYKSVSTVVNIAEYKSDFLNRGGIDPMEMAKDTTLKFAYEGTEIYTMWIVLIFFSLQ